MKKSLCRNLRKNATPQEIILWSRLKNKQLGYKFRRQHPIGKYIVDFYCSELKLIIEIDGWQHKKEFHSKKEVDRTYFLLDNNYYILRFWNNEINKNLESVLQKIIDTCNYLEKSPTVCLSKKDKQTPPP